MYDPSIPGIGWRMHYDRLERVYTRLQAGTQSSVEYVDDLHHFFQDCLHLSDWIGNDRASCWLLADVRAAMLSNAALQDAADLGNASKHMIRDQPARRTHITRGDVTVFVGQNKPAEFSHIITRADGTTLNAKDLVRNAFAAWRSLLQSRGLLT